jgi:hypothetical protein
MNLFNIISSLNIINKNELSIGDYVIEANSGYPDHHIYEITKIGDNFFVANLVAKVDENGISSITVNDFFPLEDIFENNFDFFAVVPKEYYSIIRKILVFS